MAKPLQAHKGAPRFPEGRGDTRISQVGRRPLLLAGAAWAAGGAAPQPAARRTAIFPFMLDDTSLQGEMQGARADEQARLGRLDTQLRGLLVESGRCVPVDIAPVAAEARASDLRFCSACATDMAQRLGAELVVIPWVQKVSNLILNINVTILDAASGRVVAGGSVDIRGNTDESWSRGLSYLGRERLLAAPWQASP
jgi:hypothetical protein